MAYDKTKLSEAEVAKFLAAHPKWTRAGEEISRTFELADFHASMAFVNKVAEAANQADHHPDIDIRYSKVRLALTTHDAGGLTFRDTDLASKADEFAGA
jgi:4a-hydroxytetrahydrobiopterin dehydratase